MPDLRVIASARIDASASIVYDLIADYHEGHPSILPPQYFRNLVVEEGGRGAGTRIRYEMIAFGRVKTSYASVTEPEPGRVLVETDRDGRVVTTFTVEPEGASAARVTFETIYRARGLLGLIERVMVPGYLEKVYAAELAQLAQRAVERMPVVTSDAAYERRAPQPPGSIDELLARMLNMNGLLYAVIATSGGEWLAEAGDPRRMRYYPGIVSALLGPQGSPQATYAMLEEAILPQGYAQGEDYAILDRPRDGILAVLFGRHEPRPRRNAVEQYRWASQLVDELRKKLPAGGT